MKISQFHYYHNQAFIEKCPSINKTLTKLITNDVGRSFRRGARPTAH